MQELNMQEIEQVGGAGTWMDNWLDLRQIFRELGDAFNDLVNSTTDIMCTVTSDC
jgi:hypothetical protein